MTDGAPGAPVPACSGFEEPQLGDEELAGGGCGVVGVGRRGQAEGPGDSGVGGLETVMGPGATAGPFNCGSGRVSSILLGSVSGMVGKAPVGDGEETGPGGVLSFSCGRLLEVSMPLTLLA